MSDLISRLSEMRSDYNCFDENEEPYYRALSEAIQLASAQSEQRWIPCSERLPEEHIGFYLVTVQKRRITTLNVIGCDDTVYDIDIARWDYDRRAPQRGYHWCKADKVIAWMPLPEPYCPNCGARMES